MAGVVILQGYIFLQIFGQAEVSHGVFGGEEGSGEVVESVFDFDVEVGIGNDGLD